MSVWRELAGLARRQDLCTRQTQHEGPHLEVWRRRSNKRPRTPVSSSVKRPLACQSPPQNSARLPCRRWEKTSSPYGALCESAFPSLWWQRTSKERHQRKSLSGPTVSEVSLRVLWACCCGLGLRQSIPVESVPLCVVWVQSYPLSSSQEAESRHRRDQGQDMLGKAHSRGTDFL